MLLFNYYFFIYYYFIIHYCSCHSCPACGCNQTFLVLLKCVFGFKKFIIGVFYISGLAFIVKNVALELFFFPTNRQAAYVTFCWFAHIVLTRVCDLFLRWEFVSGILCGPRNFLRSNFMWNDLFYVDLASKHL